MRRFQKIVSRSRRVFTGATSGNSSQEANQANRSKENETDPSPKVRASLEPRHCVALESELLEWAVRRVQYVFLTKKFTPFTPAGTKIDIDHDCLYCSCRCERPAIGGVTDGSSSTSCEHCLYYPESHSRWCIGSLRERSGSIAYVLRHSLVKEMPVACSADETALEILRLMPFGFAMIEKVRQSYHTYPLGKEVKFDRSFFATNFIASVGLNGYEGYRCMLTNARSMVEPMSRDEWDLWYHAQIRLMTPPLARVGNKRPLPRRPQECEARFLRHVVVETDPKTGSRFYTNSPRIHVGEDDKYIRLEFTSSPPGDPCQSNGNRQAGSFRVYHSVASEGVSTGPVFLEEDVVAGGYPVATLEGAPLKQFCSSHDREFHYIVEYDREFDVSESIPLTKDDKYLKIFLTSN